MPRATPVTDRASSPVQPAPGSGTPPNLGNAGAQPLSAEAGPPTQAAAAIVGQAAQGAGSSVPLVRSGHSPPDAGQPPGSGRLANPGQPAPATPGMAQQPSLGQAGVQTILAGPGTASSSIDPPGVAQPGTVEPG